MQTVKLGTYNLTIREIHVSALSNQNTQTNFDSSVRAQLFDAVAEHSFESVLVTKHGTGADGYPIVYVNKAFTEMTGYGVEEVMGKSPSILQGPKTDPAVLARLASDLAAGQTFHGVAVNYRKDGSEFTLEWKVTPVADSQGKITHLVSVQREI